MKKVNIISLGCSKNLVDTELLMKQLEKAGYGVEVDVENSKAKIVVINTCGFIGDAKEESINTILEQVERKQEGEVDKIYVMGCLSQRYDCLLYTSYLKYTIGKRRGYVQFHIIRQLCEFLKITEKDKTFVENLNMSEEDYSDIWIDVYLSLIHILVEDI